LADTKSERDRRDGGDTTGVVRLKAMAAKGVLKYPS
jgi:S-adenosylhomocysteine hydrolase